MNISKIPAQAVSSLVLTCLAVSGCGDGQGDRAAELTPRVVLVTLDTYHVDFASPYNPAIEITPNLGAFAERGTVFERAYTTVPITLPSHTSLMSGRHPAELGVMVNGDIVGDDVTTLAEILAGAGYRTGAFLSLGVLKDRFGLSQGFEHYDDDLHRLRYRWYRTADEVLDQAEGWLQEVGDTPFFAWFHLSDPHEPYVTKDAPPDVELDLDGRPLGAWNLTSAERHSVTFELPPGVHRLTWTSRRVPREDDRRWTSLRLKIANLDALAPWMPGRGPELAAEHALTEPFSIDLENGESETRSIELRFAGRIHDPPPSEVWEQYALEVAFMDRQLGRLRQMMAARGPDVPTLWILVSDHGEGLYRRGILGHADAAHEDQLRIVWQMEGPGVAAGRRIDSPVLIEDVLPTVLDLLGLPAPDGISGVSQRGCWSSEGCNTRQEWWSFGADAATGEIRAVAGHRGDWKLLAAGKHSGCFHLPDDPWEERNLGRAFTRRPERMPPEVEALTRQMEGRWSDFQERMDSRDVVALDPEQRELLESLGYLGN